MEREVDGCSSWIWNLRLTYFECYMWYCKTYSQVNALDCLYNSAAFARMSSPRPSCSVCLDVVFHVRL